MNRVKFTIEGEPTGKGRPRIFNNGGKIHGVTPQKTANYENLVKLMFQQTGFKPTDEQYNGEVCIEVFAYYSIPKSAAKGKRLAMEVNAIRPTKKPDCDNCLKIICDSLNGIAYRDDSQIVYAEIHKYYSERPRVEVKLTYKQESEVQP